MVVITQPRARARMEIGIDIMIAVSVEKLVSTSQQLTYCFIEEEIR